jgi:hypothetical protein
MIMRKFAVVTALAIGFAATLSNQPATAGTHHYKRNITLTLSQRARHAQAYSAPLGSVTPDLRYFDEALSPPAGH